ncbi:DNA-binding transcription factor yap1 [Pseudogymnoascus australis]
MASGAVGGENGGTRRPRGPDLLFAALNSNRATGSDQQNGDGQTIAPAAFDNSITTSPLQAAPGSGSLANLDESPFIDYDYDFDNEASYGEFDFGNLPQGQMIGNLPGSSSDGDAAAHETHDKRSLSDDEDNEDEPDGKRREGDDKTSKKPGRKPLTSEPTSKRKAQNRAAQRAFRERKEKHLKDLETKVQDLEKASEAANHENLILRAKVDKMTAELKEYKQAAVSRQTGSNPLMPMLSTYHKASNQAPHNPNDVNFSFEFPKFGQLPGPPVLSKPDSRGPKSTTSPGEAPSRSTSFTSNLSPLDSGSHNSLSFGSNQNLANTNQSNYSGLYNGAQLEGMTNDNFNYMLHHAKGSTSNSSADSGSGPTSTGHNTSHSSPASSNSHHGTSSSCGTSPEPYTQSPPASKTDNNNASNAAAGSTTLSTIGEESHNPILLLLQALPSLRLRLAAHPTHHDLSPLNASTSNTAAPTPAPSTTSASNNNANAFDVNSLDWLAAQNGNQFDPQLFGDYREPHDNILTGLYDDSFFSEAFAMPGDFSGSPFTLDATPQTTTAPTPQTQHQPQQQQHQQHHQGGKRDLIGEIDAQLDEDEVVPAESEMLTCTNMWEQIQACPAVQNGEIDMDSLCSQLQQKAKCSGEGPVIQETDFKDVLDTMFAPGGSRLVL